MSTTVLDLPHQSLRKRLDAGVAILALIDERRRQSGLPHLGAAIERATVMRELDELALLAERSGPRSTR